MKIVGGKQVKKKFSVAKFEVPSKCYTCDGTLQMGGPIWNQKIHDIDFVKRLIDVARNCSTGASSEVKLGTSERIQAVLTGIIEEDILGSQPLSYDFNHIQSELKVHNPKKSQLIAAFRSVDYMAVQTYYSPKLYKTNAPPEVVYDIFKSLVIINSHKHILLESNAV